MLFTEIPTYKNPGGVIQKYSFPMKRKLDWIVDGEISHDEYLARNEAFEEDLALGPDTARPPVCYLPNFNHSFLTAKEAFVYKTLNDIPNPGDATTPPPRKIKFWTDGDEDISEVLDRYTSLLSGGSKFKLPLGTLWKYPYAISDFAWYCATKNNPVHLLVFKRDGALVLCQCSCKQWILTASMSELFLVNCPACDREGMGSLMSMPWEGEYDWFFDVKAPTPKNKKRKLDPTVIPIISEKISSRVQLCFQIYMRMKVLFFKRLKTLDRGMLIFGHLAKFEGVWYDVFVDPLSEHPNVVNYLLFLLFIEDVNDFFRAKDVKPIFDEMTYHAGAIIKEWIVEKKRKIQYK